MRKLFTLFGGLLLSAGLFAQVPQSFSYQAVVRNSDNELLNEQQVGVQISIREGAASGPSVYTETHSPTTNSNGLFSIEIGNGTAVSGDFNTIDWSVGNYFIQTEIDPEGGSAYSIDGVSAVNSVPYALYAEQSTPQALSLNAATGELTISSGNTVTLPLTSGGDNWGSQSVVSDVSLMGDGTASNPLSVDFSTFEAEGDNWGDQVVATDGSLNGDGTPENPLSVDFSGAETFWFENNAENGISYDGPVGINNNDPFANLHISTSTTGLLVESSGQSSDPGENTSALAVMNTQNAEGRALEGVVFGPNRGWGVIGRATTSGLNVGTLGIARAQAGSNQLAVGVVGEAGSDGGSGNTFGGNFDAQGIGQFNLGVLSVANTTNAETINAGSEFAALSTVSQNIGVRSFTTAENGGFNRAYLAVANNGSNNYGLQSFVNGSGDFNLGHLSIMDETEAAALNVGSYVDVLGSNPNAEYYGVRVFSEGNTEQFNMGIYAEVFGGENASFNAGVDGSSRTTGFFNMGTGGFATGEANDDPDKANFGLYGLSLGASNNFGVFATATTADDAIANIGIYAEAADASIENYAGFFVGDVVIDGNVEITGNIAKGAGTFKIDHPLDPANKFLVHSFVESPEMMNVYNGNIETNAEGFATVELPDYFSAANKDFRYQLTVIGTFAQAIVSQEIEGNSFVIQTSQPNVKVSWQVTGVRNDPYANANRIEPEQEKSTREQGRYLHPEVHGGEPIYGSRINERLREVNEKLSQPGDRNAVPRGEGATTPAPTRR